MKINRQNVRRTALVLSAIFGNIRTCAPFHTRKIKCVQKIFSFADRNFIFDVLFTHIFPPNQLSGCECVV